jgi:hypothetical protein
LQVDAIEQKPLPLCQRAMHGLTSGTLRRSVFFRWRFSAVSRSRLPGSAWLASGVDLTMLAQVAQNQIVNKGCGCALGYAKVRRFIALLPALYL